MSEGPPTQRTAVQRLKQRGHYDRATLYRILDEGLVCHVGFAVEGRPFVIPMGYARVGDTLILHGSNKSRLLRRLADGCEACVTVTLLDGLVLARSAFHHSMNYRSAVVFGCARRITEERDKRAALDALVEHLIPGRTEHARAANAQELSATEVLELPLDEASAKIRVGPPVDNTEDHALEIWAGVVPLRLQAEPPVPDPELRAGIEVPSYAVAYRRRTAT